MHCISVVGAEWGEAEGIGQEKGLKSSLLAAHLATGLLGSAPTILSVQAQGEKRNREAAGKRMSRKGSGRAEQWLVGGIPSREGSAGGWIGSEKTAAKFYQPSQTQTANKTNCFKC